MHSPPLLLYVMFKENDYAMVVMGSSRLERHEIRPALTSEGLYQLGVQGCLGVIFVCKLLTPHLRP